VREAVLAVVGGCVGLLVVDIAVMAGVVGQMVVGFSAVIVSVMVVGNTVMVLAERAMEADVQRRHELEPTQPQKAGKDWGPPERTLFER